MRDLSTRRLSWIATGLALSFLFVGPTTALAQSQFAGVYAAAFSSDVCANSGQLAILVRSNGTAVFAAYDVFDESGFVNENLSINSNGSFSHSNIDGEGTSINGTLTSSSVSGMFTFFLGAFQCTGTFSGARKPVTFLAEAGGYYTGSMFGVVEIDDEECTDTGNSSGSVKAIVAGNGDTFVVTRASATVCGVFATAESGGPVTVFSNGSISGTTLDGTFITGSLNTATHEASGTFIDQEDGFLHSGNWLVTRRFPLEVPNDPPVAANDTYEVLANHTLTVGSAEGVLANDSDADGDTLSAVLASTAPNGTLTLNSNGGFTYTPDKGFSGVDSFTYRVSDGLANSNLATVTITVEALKAMPWLSLLLD